MRLLVGGTQYQRGSDSEISSGGSRRRNRDRDSKRNRKDKGRTSPALPPTASPTLSDSASRQRPSRALPAVSSESASFPSYWSEYDRMVKRLAEEERTLLAAQRRLEADVRDELNKRRTRRERKEEEKEEELNFVSRFLLSSSGRNAIALRRSEEEKQKERERRLRGLPMFGSEAEEEEADEDDESSHEDEDDDEEEERKRRKQQRLQRRKERREAKEARAAAERARVDEQLVDETVPFVRALSVVPGGDDEDETVAGQFGSVKVEREERKEAVAGDNRAYVVKVKEEKEADMMAQPLLSAKPEESWFDEPSPSVFDGVEQDAWEKRIVWEDEQVKAEEEERQERQAAEERRQRSIAALKTEDVPAVTAAATSSSALSFSSFSLPSLSAFSATAQNRPPITLTWLKFASAADRERARHTALERTSHTQLTLPPSHPSNSTTDSSREWRGVVLRPVGQSANSSVVSSKQLLSHCINQSLLTDGWLNAIVWDESDLQQKRNQLLQHHALLLDQNDPQLLLASTHTLTHLSQTTVAAPSLLDQFKRYNISHDAVQGSDTLSLRVLKILHAAFAANLDPLVYRTHLTSTELAHYHRPLLSFPADVATTMAIKAEGAAASVAQGEEREQQARYVPRTMEELSASDGDIIVCEYLERYPPLLMNVGMCSQLITYYRKQGELDLHQPDAPDGDVVVLTTKDDSPFLANLKPGQTVTALTNNMYISPVIRHTPTPHTFLLVRVVGQNYWTVRALPSGCYVVGQQEPKLSVPYPDRSHAYELLRKQLEVFIYKRMRQHNRKAIEPRDISREFGHSVVVDTIARRVLKDIAVLNRSTGVWEARLIEWPSEEKLQLLCTPEDVCAYEAMRAADSRLKEAGVKRFTNVKQISDIIDQLTQDDVSRVAIYIEKQLHLMPWTLTKGFLAGQDGKGTLRLTGRGNPFSEGCGYSYINEKVTAKKPTDSDFPELQEPKKKTGTNADLRKLTMDEMGAALQKLGMGADEVAKMLRWDRVRAISRLSKEAVQEGKFPNLKRFARQARPTSAKMMEEYRRDIQAIFDRELAMLAWQGRPDYSHEVDDDVAAVKEKGGARKVRERQGVGGGRSDYLAQKKKEREEEEEYKDFLASREKALRQDQTATRAVRPTDRSRAGSPATAAAASSSPALGGALTAAGKKKKKVLITKLQHVIKVTNKDGSQTVHTKVYGDRDTLRDFVLDCQNAVTESSSNGQRLRQRLQLNSLPVEAGGKKEGKEKSGKEEDEDEEGERQLKGVPQVELIPYTRGTKIKTLKAYQAKYSKAGRQQAAVTTAYKGRRAGRRAEDDVEYMFTLDDDDWNRPGDPFSFPGLMSPSLLHSAASLTGRDAAPSSLLTSTSSGTLKLSLRQLHQTPQDVYVKAKVKRKVTGDAEPSLTSLVQQPYKKKVLSRRRGDPRIFLSSCLLDILNVVSEAEYAAPFREPVTDDIAENYSVCSHHRYTLFTTSLCQPSPDIRSPAHRLSLVCCCCGRTSSTTRWTCAR